MDRVSHAQLVLKREALRPLLQGFLEGHRTGLSPEELKVVNRAYQRLKQYEWPSKQFCPCYYQLGQFQHGTLTLPRLDGREPVTKRQQRQLLGHAIAIINQAAGSQYIPAYRIVPEYQAIDDRFDPFHIHFALSIHRFRKTSRAVVQRLRLDDYLDHRVLERFFSVPPLLLTGTRASEFQQRWYHRVGKTLGVPVHHHPDLVHVTFCHHLVQDRDDRQRVGDYHRDTLKELKYGIDFRYRRRKRDVRVVRCTDQNRSALYYMSVDDFVRRYVVLPLQISSSARLLGALRKGPFTCLLTNASHHGFLDRPIQFFELLGRGIPWERAERATEDLMAQAERRRPPAIERAPEPRSDWEDIYMRPGSPDEW